MKTAFRLIYFAIIFGFLARMARGNGDDRNPQVPEPADEAVVRR